MEIKVLKRDHYKCRECHKTGNNIKLHVHHIDEWFNNQRLDLISIMV